MQLFLCVYSSQIHAQQNYAKEDNVKKKKLNK